MSLVLLVCGARAENIIYPANAGIVDVVEECGLDNTGLEDVTDTLQKIITRFNQWKVVYLPDGTYKVSGSLEYLLFPTPERTGRGPILQGQSREGTVIRLAENTFTDAANPVPVLNTGDGIAQCFSRAAANLTILVSSGNPGAVGIHWYGNNEALLNDVNVISEDGQGVAGIDLRGSEQGPSIVRDAHVEGFAKGIWSSNLNSVTFLRLSLSGQTECGIYHENASLYIDSLTSVNSVPAVVIDLTFPANLTLINARLSGGSSSEAAIQNDGGQMFLRDIVTSGYSAAVQSTGNTPPSGSTIDEYCTHNALSLFTSPTTSMRLPMRQLPNVTWEQDLTKWANVITYKGGLGQPQRSDTEAFQAAFDAPGKTTVLLASGKAYLLNDTIRVRGGVSRIVGTPGAAGGVLLFTDEATSSVIKVERLTGMNVVQRSSRTLILESMYSNIVIVEGSGDVYISDVVTGLLRVTNPQAHVWAWQWNAENAPQTELQTQAGSVWIFGWKHETSGTVADLTGGHTEILGFVNYTQQAGGNPEFILNNANFCLAGGSEVNFVNGWHSLLVRETRGGLTEELLPSETGTGNHLPLYTAYDQSTIPVSVDMPIDPGAESAEQFGASVFRALCADGGAVRVSWHLPHVAPTRLRLLNASGQVVRALTVPSRPAANSAVITTDGLPGGTYYAELSDGATLAAAPVAVVR